MNHSPGPLHNVRLLFGFLRGCTLFLLVAYPLVILVQPLLTPDDYRKRQVATVSLKTNQAPIRISEDGKPAKIAVSNLSGSLEIVGSRVDAPFATVTRWSLFATKFTRTLFFFVVFHLIWQLCRNLEQQEVFSQRNLILVRRLGLTLICYAVVESAVNSWAGWRIARYVADHLTFEGASAVALARYGQFDRSLFLAGLGVIVVVEVFRQGIALKQEADLTV